MRFSGHETFPFRYAWLPKAYRAIKGSADALSDDEAAMEALGLGKNMVNAVRFWVDATDVAKAAGGREFKLTELGEAIFRDDGHDPYLEDIRTLWILHWRIASQPEPDALFAWEFLLNHWHHPEICRSEVLAAFQREAPPQSRALSLVTLGQHFDVFLRSYFASRSRGSTHDEDVLDCPLAALRLLEQVGERRGPSGKNEPIYRFRREAKPEITPALFAWFLDDFWTRRHASEQTLTFRQLAVGPGSPGQILKLPEDDLRHRLDKIESETRGAFVFRSSAAQPMVVRGSRRRDFLASVYKEPSADA